MSPCFDTDYPVSWGIPHLTQIADTRREYSALTRSIELRLERVNQVLGPIDLGETTGELQQSDIQRILTALGCQLTPKPNQEGFGW
jgi:phenylalanyl-tRNA synthetase beta chain